MCFGCLKRKEVKSEPEKQKKWEKEISVERKVAALFQHDAVVDSLLAMMKHNHEGLHICRAGHIHDFRPYDVYFDSDTILFYFNRNAEPLPNCCQPGFSNLKQPQEL